MDSDLGYFSDSSSGEYLDIEELEDVLPLEDDIESGPQVMEEIDIAPSSQSEKTEASKATSLHARAYQLEMLEKSLKENIIVTVSTHETPSVIPFLLTSYVQMDTGSGKTQV